MSYRVELLGSAARELSRIHPELRGAIRARIDALGDDPRPHGVRPLKGKMKGLWRIRVGDYRIIYAIDPGHSIVTVAAIGPRESVYS